MTQSVVTLSPAQCPLYTNFALCSCNRMFVIIHFNRIMLNCEMYKLKSILCIALFGGIIDATWNEEMSSWRKVWAGGLAERRKMIVDDRIDVIEISIYFQIDFEWHHKYSWPLYDHVVYRWHHKSSMLMGCNSCCCKLFKNSFFNRGHPISIYESWSSFFDGFLP